MEFIIKENNMLTDLYSNKKIPLYSILLDFINKPISELEALKNQEKSELNEKYLIELIQGYLDKSIKKIESINNEKLDKALLNKTQLDLIKDLQEDTINMVESFFFTNENSTCFIGYMMNSIVYKVTFNSSEKVINEVFGIDDINTYCQFAITKLFNSGTHINKCENCGKYFIPLTRNDEIYCDNVFSNGRTCKHIGYENKIKNDDVLREYRRAYKNKNSYKQRTKLKNPDAEKEFKQWVYAAKLKMDDCINKKITLEEFKKWLDMK